MLASEVYTFSDGINYGISIRLLFQAMGKRIQLYIIANCKSMFDAISSSKRLKEICLMNDAADFHRAYEQK